MIVCHGLVAAAHIRLSNAICGYHELEVYSSQAIVDWKCFLRMKVDDPYEKKFIHTVRGVGYVLEDRG